MRRAEILKVIEDALLPRKGWIAPEALTFARRDAVKVYAALTKQGVIARETEADRADAIDRALDQAAEVARDMRESDRRRANRAREDTQIEWLRIEEQLQFQFEWG